jgi:hypothetical protein
MFPDISTCKARLPKALHRPISKKGDKTWAVTALEFLTRFKYSTTHFKNSKIYSEACP